MQLKQFIDVETENLIHIFQENGYKIYPVGGCVRDALLDLVPNDIDMTTNATPLQMKSLLDKHSIAYTAHGEKFGTITALLPTKQIEITTFRSEQTYYDHRHCDVCFIDDIKDDLKRRDFTINAMAYDFDKDEVIDYFNGINDLNQRKLHAVGDLRKRIEEDHLRALRALRFAIRFNLSIDIDDYIYLKQSFENNLLDKLAKERIQEELLKIFSTKNLTLEHLQLLTPFFFALFPDLEQQLNFDQQTPYHDYTLWEHTKRCVNSIEQAINILQIKTEHTALLRLCALLHDIGKPKAKQYKNSKQATYIYHAEIGLEITKQLLTDKLCLSNKQFEFICQLIKYHDIQYNPNNSKSMRKVVRKLGKEYLPDFFILTLADKLSQKQTGATTYSNDVIIGWQTCKKLFEDSSFGISVKELAINGNDLIQEFSLSPSKEIRYILDFLIEAIDHEQVTNEREELISYVKKHYF